MTDTELLDALERLQGTGPEFNGFLANHGPMAVEALLQLGRPDRLGTWADHYRKRLDTAPAVRRGITDQDWELYLGEAELAGDWNELLRRDAAEMSWEDLLGRWWPRLLPGLAASATHGVIRTAHAVRSLAQAGPRPDPLLVDELAQGLALWAARYQPLPGNPRLRGPMDAVEATRALPRLDPAAPERGPGIGGRLGALVDLPEFPTALEAWGAPADPDEALDVLIGAAGRVLAAREDAPIAFCHTVTAPAAIRLVLPHLSTTLRTASVAASWQVVGAIVSAFAEPRQEAESRRAHDPAPVTEGEIDDLRGRAVEHGDEHVIKLTEAALREFGRSRDTTLLVAARRFRHRLPPLD
jgi:hypothetical protein